MPGQGDPKSRAKRKKTSHGGPKVPKLAIPGERQGLHVCKNCSRDVSQELRIKCAVCPAFHLCLDCFRVGAEIVPHKHSHAYQVHGDLSFPLYAMDWGADEEMLLLEGIAAYGLGSWAAVSTLVSTKSAEECWQHYFDIYVRSPTTPLPQPVPEMQGVDPLKVAQDRHAGRLIDSGQSSPMESPATDLAGQLDMQEPVEPTEGPAPAVQNGDSIDAGGIPAKKLQRGKAEASGEGRPSEAAEQQLSTRGLPAARSEGQKTVATPAATPSAASQKQQKLAGGAYEMTGFHNKRAEFEHEYDNDAELLISELEVRVDDPPEERDEKLRLIEVYNRRLTEREQRRTAVISQGLLDIKRSQALERQQTAEEREVRAQLRVFARFQTPAEHNALVAGVLLERLMRARLQELKELRAEGVRTFASAAEHDMEQRRRVAEAWRGGDRSQRYVARTGMDDSSVMSQAAVALSDGSGRGRELSRLRFGSAASLAVPGAGFRQGGGATAALVAWRARRGIGLDITATPGGDALTSKERQLCATTRLLPSHYLACKASLLREAERRGGSLPRSEARHMFRMDAGMGLRIYDLLASCGWLGEPDAPDSDPAAAAGDSEPGPVDLASPASSAMNG